MSFKVQVIITVHFSSVENLASCSTFPSYPVCSNNNIAAPVFVFLCLKLSFTSFSVTLLAQMGRIGLIDNSENILQEKHSKNNVFWGTDAFSKPLFLKFPVLSPA